MIVLAGAQFLGRHICLLIGAGIVLGHNLLDSFWPAGNLFGVGSSPWVALHAQMSRVIGPFQIAFVYPLLPWIGVMLLGFGAAGLFERGPGKTKLSTSWYRAYIRRRIHPASYLRSLRRPSRLA
jgi:uncharacterized membrane protein